MSTIPDYAELRCVSNFSFLRGASQPEELIERAKQLGDGAEVPNYDADRVMGPEIEAAAELVRNGTLLHAAQKLLGELE